jgi:hypothetical protein
MSFETLNVELRGLSMRMTLRKGDVVVHTSWWRRWRKREEWAVVKNVTIDNKWPLANVFWVTTDEELTNYQLGKCDVVNDPERWPDEVCAVVARLKLSE